MAKYDVTNQKNEFSDLISERLRNALKELNYTQAELRSLCITKGFNIPQSAISKIFSSGKGITLLNLSQICSVLDLDLNEILSMDPNTQITLPKNVEKETNPVHRPKLIRRTDEPEFQAYLGRYVIYFYPTFSNSDMPYHTGRLYLERGQNDKECIVRFSFKTGKLDRNKEPIEKKYTGTAVISPHMQSLYCQLYSEDIGEYSYFIFNYMPITFEELECRIAMVLTSSAGGSRLPVAHRMLICRTEPSDKYLKYAMSQLLFNQSEIIISESAFKKMVEDDDTPQGFKDYFCDMETKTFKDSRPMPYYYITESLIRESFMDKDDRIKAICMLRKYSIAQPYNKIGSKADDTLYKLVTMDKKENPQNEDSTEGGQLPENTSDK